MARRIITANDAHGGEAMLQPGDLVIQRNTLHAWQVRGDVPAAFWAVMVSLLPAAG